MLIADNLYTAEKTSVKKLKLRQIRVRMKKAAILVLIRKKTVGSGVNKINLFRLAKDIIDPMCSHIDS